MPTVASLGSHRHYLVPVVAILVLVGHGGPGAAQPLPIAPPPRAKAVAPDLAALIAKPRSEAAAVVRLFDADRGALARAYSVPFSRSHAARLHRFYTDWSAALKAVDPEPLTAAAREELVALRGRVEGEIRDLEVRVAEETALAPLLPFAGTITGLEEARRRMEPMDAPKAAGAVDRLKREIDQARAATEAALKKGELAPGVPATRAAATRAADAVGRLQTVLKAWHGFYTGYDPDFTWWMAEPYKQADAALEAYAKFLREKAKDLPAGEWKPVRVALPAAPPHASDVPDLKAILATPTSELTAVVALYRGDRRGPFAVERDPVLWLDALKAVSFERLSRPAQLDYLLLRSRVEADAARRAVQQKAERPPVPKDDTGIVGRPIGRAALQAELAAELVPYTPEELMDLARAELAWCDAEIRKAAREMGCGDDWKKALEKVKTLHVRPGQQPGLIRDLSAEAVEYLKANDLITVPPLAAETWRMAMMTPERQLLNPFFTGGEVISVSFPTNTMSHEAKLQSLRGNNPHFSRATVHHELIPGHHLQQFSNARNQPHRAAFATSFWTEGWAVYWEMVLYERGFPKTAEDRVGFLFWRMHRCARVVFSLGYHLGTMTPRQCIDFLVERVGHEPENATAEVRRSFAGGYGPLYQCGYLIGAMQFRALRKELVASGKMTERAFHDAVLKEHSLPVAAVRAAVSGRALTADALAWRFADAPGKR